MWNSEDKILGVIGGMGPAATQLFYRMVVEKTDAVRDQEHVDMILLNHASMPDRTESILQGREDEVFRLLLADALKLQELGACAIAIPCNTSHYFADRLQAELAIPLINMIRETARAVAGSKRQPKRVGILATDGTVKGGLYHKACEEAGLEAVDLSPEKQKMLMDIIYLGIKAEQPIDYNDFIAIEGELACKGCQGAILGCTELSVLKERYRLPDFYTDAMAVLAERAITACGRKVK